MNLSPQISPVQLFILCFNSSFGAAMATLPRSIASDAKEDMWLTIIVGGIFFLFAVWAAAKLASYYPNDTIMEITRTLLGPLLGKVIIASYIIMIFLVPAVSMRTFAVVIKTFLLPDTPPQVVIIIKLMLLVYATQHGLSPLVRLQQFNFIPTQFLFLIVILIGFLAFNAKNFLPFLAGGIVPVLKGSIPVWYAYTGPDSMIGFLYPFVTRKKAVFKWAAAAVFALMAVYTIITVIIQGIIGPKDAAYMLIPTLIAYRAVEIPDTFIERLDGYFLVLWIPIYFFCMLNWIHLASFYISRVLKLEYSRPIPIFLAPLIYYVIFSMPDYTDVIIVNVWINYAYIIWGAGILPLLVVLAWLKNKRKASPG